MILEVEYIGNICHFSRRNYWIILYAIIIAKWNYPINIYGGRGSSVMQEWCEQLSNSQEDERQNQDFMGLGRRWIHIATHLFYFPNISLHDVFIAQPLN